jgi:hypothetical protein
MVPVRYYKIPPGQAKKMMAGDHDGGHKGGEKHGHGRGEGHGNKKHER